MTSFYNLTEVATDDNLRMDNPAYKKSRADLFERDEGEPDGRYSEGDIAMRSLAKEDEDPWELPELKQEGIPWKDQTNKERVFRVLKGFIKICLLLLLLYLFICSLDLMSSAFRLLGGKAAGEVFRNNELLANPVTGVVIGVLVTVLVQSSSTSTSIVITMVGSGFIDPPKAVPIIMGANIGTSVTNTIVSLGHAGNKDEFRRAFAGATVHDMFNWLSVCVMLPIEAISEAAAGEGLLFFIAKKIVDGFFDGESKDLKKDLLKVITKPLTDKIIQIDKKVITKIANKELNNTEISLQKICVEAKINDTTGKIISEAKNCENLFRHFGLNDPAAGALLLFLSLLILCLCLIAIVKLLHSMVRGHIAIMMRKVVNMNFPGCAKYLTDYVVILFGAAATILVQSSSIFTSTITPLVGIGVVTLERTYPLTLGANIGTTCTGLLAAMSQDGTGLYNSLIIAFCHLLFNIFGIFVWFPIPFMRNVPIRMAKKLGMITADYRWFPFVYLFLTFFIFPAFVLGLSVPGWKVLVGVGVPILVLLIAIGIINLLQDKKPHWLPRKLRSWDFLPIWLHSLEPYDKFFKICCVCRRCKDLKS